MPMRSNAACQVRARIIIVNLVRWGGLERLQRMVIARDIARMDMPKREKRVAPQWNALV